MTLEQVLFHVAAGVSLAATLMVVTRRNASHALIYLIVSLLAVAVIFYVLGAPFAAALEVVIYAGAIMVLFLFVVMMLDLGRDQAEQERQWFHPRMWIGPGLLTAVLLVELLVLLERGTADGPMTTGTQVTAQEVGITLFGPYLLAVELASVLLLAALVGAWHLGRRYLLARRGEVG